MELAFKKIRRGCLLQSALSIGYKQDVLECISVCVCKFLLFKMFFFFLLNCYMMTNHRQLNAKFELNFDLFYVSTVYGCLKVSNVHLLH